MPRFATKYVLSGYFGARTLKNFCDIVNQHPRICQIAKFCEKMPKFETKSVLFAYFWAGI